MLAAFAHIDVVVIGDALLDRYLVGSASRLCRERPVPVVVMRDDLAFPGGAANVAANAAALGARVRFVGALGADESGDALRELLRQRGVDASAAVTSAAVRNGRKTRVIADDHYLARVDIEPVGCDAYAAQELLAAQLERACADCDLLIVSDYGGGTIGPQVFAALRAICAGGRVRVVVDARDLRPYAALHVDLVTPSLEEAAALCGLPASGDDVHVERLARDLAGRLDAATVALTLGANGVVMLCGGAPARVGARRVSVRNTCGAGDAFATVFGLGLAAGGHALDAGTLAAEAAAVAVTKDYTATVSLRELSERLELLGATNVATPAEDDDVYARIAGRRAGARLVFTNGVFDLLHAGHLSLLQRARAAGDVLVVGLNSDRSARLVKGPHRPITDQQQRRAALEALGWIDEVVVFDEPTADALIERIRPDLYIRGDDRDRDHLTEAATAERLGISVALLPLVGDLTTSRIIARVNARSDHWMAALDA